MKKLMIVAVASIAAVGAFAVESANIVGYQTKDTVTGFNFVIPTFKAVSGGSIHIQDIKIANATDWGDNIQVLDEGGATIAAYMYATAAESGFEADGWVSEDFTTLADVTFAPGQSILINTENPATVTFAGAVSTEDTVVETVPGFNFVGKDKAGEGQFVVQRMQSEIWHHRGDGCAYRAGAGYGNRGHCAGRARYHGGGGRHVL